MAESRRVQLTTLPCNASIPVASVQKCPAGVEQEKEIRPDSDTVRLVLSLFEPDERTFPEFSYSQLVANETNKTKDRLPQSRFEQEENADKAELAAIARKFDEKYGGKPKKKKDRIQDLIDIGYGYDDEDSFIDNSEAYDEFVPVSITTKFGGFYINSGVLQFRQTSDTEDLIADENTREPSKKRKLNGTKDKPKKKQCREDGEIQINGDPETSTLSKVGPEELKKKKKKKAAGTLSVTSMLKKFQREKEKERLNAEKARQRAAAIMEVPTIPLYPADAGGGGGTGLADPLLSLIGSTNEHALIQAANTVDFDIDLDSLFEVSEDSVPLKLAPQSTEMQLFTPKAVDQVPSADAHTEVQPPNYAKHHLQPKLPSEQTQPLSQTSATSSQQSVPLPEGLPAGLEDNIKKLIVAAKTSEGESKLKFFTPEINAILLDIEQQCREQGGQLRSKVYTYLSSFLPCSRETLLKRVKKLLLSHMEEPPDVEDPVHKLKEAIGKVMPEQIACFQGNCQAFEQVKNSKATEDDKEGKLDNTGPEDGVEEKGGKKGGPKKLFKWNEEIRECLCRVLSVKMEGYKKERKGSQEMDDYLKTVLDNEVKPLWPKGWMQSRVLLKESKKMLNLSTTLPTKRAKPEKKKRQQQQQQQPPPPSLSAATAGCSVLTQEADDVFIDGMNLSSSVSLADVKRDVSALKKLEPKKQGVDSSSSIPAESDEAPVSITSAPTRSLLDLLADQALAQEQPLSVSHELLAAAVAKYKQSVQHWSFGFDTKSPPLPPPPPQTSPVSFPVSGLSQVAVPQKLQMGDFARSMDAGQVVIISDESDTTIQ